MLRLGPFGRQHRPQDLIREAAADRPRLTQHAFNDGAEPAHRVELPGRPGPAFHPAEADHQEGESEHAG